MNAMAYKGYEAIVDYDADAELFHGEVVNTRDVITFQGRSVEELKAALADSVEDYLAFCRERGEDPEKPYSGQFVVRVDPALHRAVAAAAKRAGASSQQMGRRRAGASDGALSVARPVRRRRPVKSNALRHGLAFGVREPHRPRQGVRQGLPDAGEEGRGRFAAPGRTRPRAKGRRRRPRDRR